MSKHTRIILRLLLGSTLFASTAMAKVVDKEDERKPLSKPQQQESEPTFEEVSERGLKAVRYILNSSPEETHKNCLEILKRAQNEHQKCRDKGECEANAYQLERPSKKDCRSLGCVTSAPRALIHPEVKGIVPEKVERVCLDAQAEIQSVLTYGAHVFAQTNDGRFGLLQNVDLPDSKQQKCERKFVPVSNDVTDAFIFNEQIYLTKRNPSASAKNGKAVSRLFELDMVDFYDPQSFKLKDMGAESSDSFVAYRGRLNYYPVGKKDRTVVENALAYDGGVSKLHEICFAPSNFPDGKVPEDTTNLNSNTNSTR